MLIVYKFSIIKNEWNILEVIIIPRKFNNSKGNNLFVEIKDTKKWNRLLREAKTLQKQQDDEKKYKINKPQKP